MPRKKKEEIQENNIENNTEGNTEKKELEVNGEEKLEVKVKKSRKKKESLKINEEEEKKDDEVKKKRTSDRSVLLREIREKAKKLAEKIEGQIGTEEIKEELDKKREMLVPLEDYVKTGIHLGTRVITPDMKKFVYRRRADSIGVLNTTSIDEQIKKAIDLVSKYKPEEVVLVCKRESGWKSAHLFSDITGIKVFTKKYPAGMMTNINLENFYEPELMIICDPWIDKNALNDAIKTNKKRIALCDTNNFVKDVNLVIPCNNKGSKSLGIVFYLIARGYVEKRKIGAKIPSMEKFIEESEEN